MLSPSRARWVTLDARQAVSAWTKHPKRNLGLVVTLEDARRRPLNPNVFLSTR